MDPEPDFLIPVQGWRGSERKIALYLVSEEHASEDAFLSEVKSRALGVGSVKESHKKLEAVLVTDMHRNDEVSQQILELKSPPFFDEVFFDGELLDLAEYVKEEMKNKEGRFGLDVRCRECGKDDQVEVVQNGELRFHYECKRCNVTVKEKDQSKKQEIEGRKSER
ncbi:hypothetical protein AKJ40_00735 [candidate division MSBL1 archaeon SCGC-AAA259M10]|uniref:Uncharacterized protein n=1 Tax=candidate division MSBL1 archaeon SCGC-AAA259M10 TaxID=1698270 RepID=A0A133V2Q2_9EURY|nr:hypothetical protein AKJ40_00735 [candidate division MSBL1 archaeon SCGC-AAA259M10]